MNQKKGLDSEKIVIDRLVQSSWILLAQRKKLKFGEVDLLFSKGDKIVLLEVKTVRDQWSVFERISTSQKSKLIKNRIDLSIANSFFDVQSWLAFVFPNKKIAFIKVDHE